MVLPRYHGLGQLGFAVLVSGATIRAPLSRSLPRDASAGLVKAQDGPIRLSATKDTPGILVLDYGVESEGIPEFEVVSASGDTSAFEMTYSETEAALGLYMVRPHVAPPYLYVRYRTPS